MNMWQRRVDNIGSHHMDSACADQVRAHRRPGRFAPASCLVLPI